VPEGDSILWAATRMRPVLEGRVPDEISTPQRRHTADRWPERLSGRSVKRVRTHGKHLFLSFEGGLVLHSHLRMTGAWDVRAAGGRWIRSPRRAWLVLRCDEHEVVQFDGPVLELMTEGRSRFDQTLAGLGPDVLAESFELGRFLARLREDDQTRGFGEALLDQRNLAGIGNIWKSEGCWEAGISPWRAVHEVSDQQAAAFIDGVRPRMLRSGTQGPLTIDPRVYRRTGAPCPRCGGAVQARQQGDENRMTYWCPECQR
jgi:endonuclease VIII